MTTTTTKREVRAVLPYRYRRTGTRRWAWGVTVILTGPNEVLVEDGFSTKARATAAGLALGASRAKGDRP